MKAALVLLAVLLAFAPAPAAAEETDYAALIDEELKDLDLSGWQQAANAAGEESLKAFGAEDVEQLIGSLAVGEGADVDGLFTSVAGMLKESIAPRLALVAALFAAAAVSGITAQLSGGASGVAGLICTAVAMLLAVAAFSSAVAGAQETVEALGEFTELAFPVLSVLLTAAGAAAGAGLLQPAAALLSTGVNRLFSSVLMPCVLAMGVCALIGCLSENRTLDKLAAFFKSLAKWVCGGAGTLYLGYLAVCGIAAGSADGLSVRAAKYLTKELVPFSGSILSGSVDALLASAAMIKNAVGVCAVLVMAAILLQPLLNTMTLQLAFRLSGALIDPVADGRLTRAVSSLADTAACLFGIMAAAGAMSMLTAGIFAALGNTYL